MVQGVAMPGCWISLLVLLLLLHMPGTAGELAVTVVERVVGNKGDTVVIPCSFVSSNLATKFILRWEEENGDPIYRYRRDYYDEAMPSPHSLRYSRYGLHLVFSGFKQADSGVKCCVIQTAVPEETKKACTTVVYMDFPDGAFRCMHDNYGTLDTFSTFVVDEPKLRLSCAYVGIYPPADLGLYQNGKHIPLQNTDKSNAVENGGLFSLGMQIEREVEVPGTYIILASSGKDLHKRIVVHLKQSDEVNKTRLVCSITSWAALRPSPYTFLPASVPPQYCTHVIWCCLPISDNYVPFPPTEQEYVQLQGLLRLKKRRPGMKILASVGGKDTQEAYSMVVATQKDINLFADTAYRIVKDYNLDGIDIYWELPSQLQRDQFTQLLKAIHERFDKDGNAKLLLSVALGAEKEVLEKSYDLPLISEYADLVNLMVYDLHGHWEAQTGHHAALAPQNVQLPYFSVDWVVNRFGDLGLDLSKASLGIPFYARTFKLCNPNDVSVGASACGAGLPGLVSNLPGIIFYNELCMNLSAAAWATVMDTIGQTPYSYNENQWISSESEESVRAKAKYLKPKGLIGAMVWEVSQDDFSNMCGKGEFTLLKPLAEELGVITEVHLPRALHHGITNTPVIVCFFSLSAQYRRSPYWFTEYQVPVQYCSHVIWRHVVIVNNTLTPATPTDIEQLQHLLSLKRKRPALKILVSMGGDDAQAEYQSIAVSKESMEQFAAACRDYLWNNQVDGLDVAWHDPPVAMKDNYMNLLKVIRTTLDNDERMLYMMSVTIGSLDETIQKAIDIVDVSKLADLINVRAFDFHYAWAERTGFSSALYHKPDTWPQYSQDHVMKQYMKKGLRAGITTLGVPFYGRSFWLCSAQSNGLKAGVCGASSTASVSLEPGKIFYNEICQKLKSGKLKESIHEGAQSVYAASNVEWIAYENIYTLAAKAKYVLDNGYAGVSVWDISHDDFTGQCGDGRFPLLRTLAEELDLVHVPVMPAPRLLCYFPSWAMFRDGSDGANKYHSRHVDARLCSHIIWMFITLDSSNMPVPAEHQEPSQLEDLVALKKGNANLKVLASVLGDIQKFGPVTSSADSMEQFAEACAKYVKQHHLDGLDLIWQWPSAQYKQSFTDLVKALRSSLSAAGRGMQLSVSLGGRKNVVLQSYDVKQISEVADVVNLMAYDFNVGFGNGTGLNAAVYPQAGQQEEYSQNWIVKQYLDQGLDPNKATLGIPFYGRHYILKDPADSRVGALVVNGVVVDEKPVPFYREVCARMMKEKDWKTEFDMTGRATYSHKDADWISHEDVRSIRYKATYLRSKGLSGAAVWDISMDDFDNMCQGDHKYPLLRALAEELSVINYAQMRAENRNKMRSDTSSSTKTSYNSIVLFLVVAIVCVFSYC